MFTMGQKMDASNPEGSFLESSANDYFEAGAIRQGEWFGKLAEEWKMSQPVHKEDYISVMNHICPMDGKALTTGQSKTNEIAWFPFQCGAQKSVSVMAMLMNDRRLVDAHRQCVKMALAELEKFAAHRVRTGADRNSDKTKITGKILAALYDHDTSRALDPQLHTHCLIANVTVDANGRRMALTESQMMKAVEFAGRYYQSMMARKCMEFGYRIRIKSGRKGVEGFEIDGVDDSVLEKYSRRRAEIEEKIAAFCKEHGRQPSVAEIQIMTLETREAKLKEITTPEVRAQQMKMITVQEYKELSRIRLSANRSVLRDLSANQKKALIFRAIDALYERQSVVPLHEIYAMALKTGMGRLTIQDVEQVIDRRLIRLSDGENELSALYTTPYWRDLEKSAVETVRDGQGKYKAYGKISPAELSPLAPDQRAAVSGVLRNRDFAVIIRGAAGAGKTTALRALDAGLIRSGCDVTYLAPTRGAVNVLKEDGFLNASTVAAFIRKQPPMSRKSVLVVDEGSLISNTSGARLIDIARKAGARIIINGDEKQHTSVEAGDFMRMLEISGHIEKFELLEIKRQIPEDYRLAIRAMAEGRTAQGLTALHGMGAVIEAKASYLEKAAELYADNVIAGKKTMLVSPTHDEIDAMTVLVRERLTAAGIIDPEKILQRKAFCDYGYTKSDLSAAELFKPGMAVRFNVTAGKRLPAGTVCKVLDSDDQSILVSAGKEKLRLVPRKISGMISLGEIRNMQICSGDKLLVTANDQSLSLTNGDTVTVKEVDDRTIYLSDGRTIPMQFDSFTYGYATTSHKSQGATTSEVILAAASLTDKAAYVGSSRGRQSVKIVCPEFKPLLDSVKKNTDRMTVQEGMKKNPKI